MKTPTLIIATYLVGVYLGIAGVTTSGSALADEIRSQSLTGPMYMGGAPEPGEVVADRIVVTRRAQFTEYGREGYIKPLSSGHFVKNDELVSDSVAEAPLRPLKSRKAAEETLPRDRFGRQ